MSKLSEEQKKFIAAGIYYGKCGCGWLVTDYPFMSCLKCGYIGCGSDEDLKRAKKSGTIINWKTKPPKGVSKSEIRDCTTYNENRDYEDDDLYDYDDYYDIMGL